ncbi:MAG: PaaI family thioesterase [candidate division WOR-3 bacterium]
MTSEVRSGLKPGARGSDFCFACGMANESGLRMKIVPFEDGCRTVFTPLRRHQGYDDAVHGGILATLLDEVIVWAGRFQGFDIVTAELVVRYKKPVLIDTPVEVFGRITGGRGRLVLGQSRITDPGGALLATAHGKFIRIS